MDKQRIENAVREILIAIGEDPDREGLLETPKRVANMYEEIFAGLEANPERHLKIFNEGNNDEMVVVRDIPLYSMCEHTICCRLSERLILHIFHRRARLSDFQSLQELLTITQDVRKFKKDLPHRLRIFSKSICSQRALRLLSKRSIFV